MHHYLEKLLRIVESMVGRSMIILLTHGKYDDEYGIVCSRSVILTSFRRSMLGAFQ